MAAGFLFGSKAAASSTSPQIRCGRGGAGNIIYASAPPADSHHASPPSSAPTSPSSRSTPSSTSSPTTAAPPRSFFVGVGGNVYSRDALVPSPSTASLSSRSDAASSRSARSSFSSVTYLLPARLGGRKG
ncbi:hypothetical protein HIM_06782 [Hirsutella minnesotensis 3608]|uniref:Uncharacterized protein n=1 Tax=Hirsutella minnesotensis 3608 TaxID=1043627 RepID=A0A0F8A4N5_9HYPO|nr:hypothetical protein HIM_06782 [Hirsutella minnesotensis 3608]